MNNSIGFTPTSPGPPHIAFRWLLRLRWGAVCCQLLLIGVVSLLFAIGIPLLILSAIIGFEIISNLFFRYRLNRGAMVAEYTFALVLLLDTILLTALLYYTGGPMNPFTLLYLVHITLAAILMRPLWSWAIAGLTVVAYATLFFLPHYEMPAHDLGMPTLEDLFARCHLVPPTSVDLLRDPMAIHLHGMLVAFGVSAFFIVFFVGRIRTALEEQQKTLTDLREQKLRNEKLASLATLAAGAAHEFSTPLATIAVAAGEMHHALQERGDDEELLADATLIRSQVDRCREILYHMAADAGEHLGEALEEFTVQRLVDECLRSLPAKARILITVTNQTGQLMIRMPFRTLSRIIRGLLKNGLDASPPDAQVALVCRIEGPHLIFEVSDHGSGMDAATMARASEPFFTTKEAGRGLGLGLYLARSAAERFGGGLAITSRPGVGTTVRLAFALHQIQSPTA